MNLSTGNAILAAVYPAGERGKAFGITGAAVGLGLASGPFLGGLILEHLDWRALFYLRLPVGILAMLIAWLYLPATTPMDDEHEARTGIPVVRPAVRGLTGWPVILDCSALPLDKPQP